MRKLHFLMLMIVTVVLGLSCKKDDNAEKYLRGKIDNVAFECNSGISANDPEPIPGSGSDPTLRITGEWPSHSLKLMLLNEGTLKEGTYTFAADKERNATLVDNNGDNYYAGNTGVFGTGQLIGSGRITISQVSKTHVTGSFEFIAIDQSQGTTKTITGGEFSIPRN